MISTSASCALSFLGALMSGRTPVMINYSTGAAKDRQNIQKRCNLSTTIITATALLEKVSLDFPENSVDNFFQFLKVIRLYNSGAKTIFPEICNDRIIGIAARRDDSCL
jgi:hypothetical protein